MALVERMADWIGDRLPRIDAASDRVDWFQVWLVAGLLLAAAVTLSMGLVDCLCHTSLLPSSTPPPRSLEGYAAAHAFADRQLQVIGVVAAAYPPSVWCLLKIFTKTRGYAPCLSRVQADTEIQ